MLEDIISDIAYSKGIKLSDEMVEEINSALHFSSEYKALSKKARELVAEASSTPFRFQFKEGIDYEILEELGYKFNPLEGGYISKDLATIILTHRNPHQRKVVQYRKDYESEHLTNVELLKKKYIIE